MSITPIGTDAAQGFAETVTVTVPATAQAGDLVVIYGATTRWPSVATPGTFTLVHSERSGTGSSWEGQLFLFTGVVGTDCAAGEGIAVGNPGGGSNNYGATLSCYRSDTGATPLYAPGDGTGFAGLADPGDTAPTAPSITLPEDGHLLFAAQVAQSSSGNSHTPPAGYTEHEDVNRAGIGLTLASKAATAGASGTAASTASIGGAWVASHLAIYDEPASDETAPTVTIDTVHGAGEWATIHDSAGYDAESDTLTVTGTASDDTELDSVEVRVDGGTFVLATLDAGAWSIDLDVSGWTAGAHTIEARSWDTSTNPSTIAEVTVWHAPSGVLGWAGIGQHAAPVTPEGWTADPPPTLAAGSGSSYETLTTHPKIANRTVGHVYVDSTVTTSGDGGSLGQAKKTLAEGLTLLASYDGLVTNPTMIVRGLAPYQPASEIQRNVAWSSTAYICAYGDERIEIDASGLDPNDCGLRFLSSADSETWHRLWIHSVPTVGVGQFRGSAIRGEGASNILISDGWTSHLEQTGVVWFECTNCVAQDGAVWHLGDGVTENDTNSADGIVASADAGFASDGCGFVRYFVANAPDDGGDLFRCINGFFRSVAVDACGEYWNGVTGGDGNGLKLGSSEDGTGEDNEAVGCLVARCRANGIDHNQGHRMTTRYNTVVDNGALGLDANSGESAANPHTVEGLVAWGNGSAGNQGTDYGVYVGTDVDDTFNSWNLAHGDPLLEDTAAGDYSLGDGSPALGAGSGGATIGASVEAIEIMLLWRGANLTAAAGVDPFA